MASISLELVIPPSTLKLSSAPVEKSVNVSNMVINSAFFQFPSGCQYLALIQVLLREGNQDRLLVPTGFSGDALDYIAYDGATPLIPIGLTLKGQSVLYARGWNEDTVNQHWIKLLLDVTPLKREG
jgi:hypothetical protein